MLFNGRRPIISDLFSFFFSGLGFWRLNSLPGRRSILSMKGSRNSPCDFMKSGLLLNLREAYKIYFTKTMFYVSEMDWLKSMYGEVIKSSNMISDENGRCFFSEEAFKAIFYLFAGKPGS